MKTQHYFLTLLLFSLILFIPGISNLPVIERDEAHFAQASRQMLQNHSYFQIRFQDKTRFQKPPGINWLQALSVKVFSEPDSNKIWPYRLPSLLGALLSVLMTWFFSRRFMNEGTATMAAAILASSFLLLLEAHMAVIDAMLLASVVLMQGALWIIYDAHQKGLKATPLWAWLFWLSFTFGFVLKGVTPLFGLLTLFTLCFVDKNTTLLREVKFFKGLLLFSFLTLCWLLLVNEAENTNYILKMVQKDLIPKLQGGHESHGKPPLFHLGILPLTFWPGSLFLWPAASFAWYKRHTPVVTFLLAWLIPAWIFFECMPTKLPQYVMPLFPALSILCAKAIEYQVQMGQPSRWVKFLQISWVVLSVGLSIFFIASSWFLLQHISNLVILLFITISFSSLIALFYARKGQFVAAISVLFIMSAIIFPMLFQKYVPALKPLWLSPAVGENINKNKLTDQTPLMAVGFEEPGLVFNFNTKLIAFSDPTSAIKILRNDPSRLALFEENQLKSLQKTQNLQLHVDAKIKGFHYSKGKWVTLVIVHG